MFDNRAKGSCQPANRIDHVSLCSPGRIKVFINYLLLIISYTILCLETSFINCKIGCYKLFTKTYVNEDSLLCHLHSTVYHSLSGSAGQAFIAAFQFAV